MNQIQLGDFAPELLPELSQYHSPVKLCRRIVHWAENTKPLRGLRVLEPSAGGGNLVRELLGAGAIVTAVEIDPRWTELLRREFPNVEVIDADFLQMPLENRFDLAVMNPPLDKGLGGRHVRHALGFAPRAVSILRSQDLHTVERYKYLWSVCDLAREAKLSRRPKYRGAGGEFETVIDDIYRQGTYNGPQSIEHWPESWNE